MPACWSGPTTRQATRWRISTQRRHFSGPSRQIARDVVVHNHPYFGSSHTSDLAIVIPIFHDGALVGYSANAAHHIDIGAATRGLIIDVPDVFAEGMLRQRISAIPNGEYRAEGWLDYHGRNRGQRLSVKVCVRVIDDRIDFDLAGSAPQTPTACNVPFEGSTKVAAFAAFRKLLLGTATSLTRVPSNQGSFLSISVIVPLGTIFNPKAPAAAEARFTQCNFMIDLILKAMAPVLPDEIIAGSSASISFASYAGVKDDGNSWVFLGERRCLWWPPPL